VNDGMTRLDLRDPVQLGLLRRYGPFSADTRVWVEGDPDPAVETAEALDGQPRVTYRLTDNELDQLGSLLAEAGLDHAHLVPKRSPSPPGAPLSHLAGDRPWSGAVPTAAIGSGHRCHPPRAPTQGVSGAVHGATWGGVSLWLVAP
jgi:hypothetical protein